MADIKRFDVTPKYSEAVIFNNVVYLAGQVATPEASVPDVKTQTQSCMKQIAELLERAGSSISSLLSATVYMTSLDGYNDMNTVWQEWVPLGAAPARTTIAGIQLAKPEWLIEITVTAAIQHAATTA
jgi:enamine deaminase RidA (YjgF/YER057c/UK114 family)